MADPGFLGVFLLLIPVLISVCWRKRHQRRIMRWQKNLNLPRHAPLFERIYRDVDGFSLSFSARKNKNAIEYTYGEVEFIPFIALLSLIKLESTAVFYDLGSGVGKAVLACAMVYPVKKSVGIEIFPQLCNSAREQITKLAMIPGYEKAAAGINFILDDFNTANLDEATHIFINSTTLIGETWEKLSVRLNYLPNLKFVITTSKPLAVSGFSLITQTEIEMSWGLVLAYIHERKN